MDLKVSRRIGLLVSITAMVVVGYISWNQMIAGSGAYPVASKEELKAELSALPLDAGANAEGELELVDRFTIATLNQTYVSTHTRDEIARDYDAAFRANGWTSTGDSARGEHAVWFCKKGIHGGVVFRSESAPVVFRVSMTSGGWARSRCG